MVSHSGRPALVRDLSPVIRSFFSYKIDKKAIMTLMTSVPQNELEIFSDQHFRTCAHGRTYPLLQMWGAVWHFGIFNVRVGCGAARKG